MGKIYHKARNDCRTSVIVGQSQSSSSKAHRVLLLPLLHQLQMARVSVKRKAQSSTYARMHAWFGSIWIGLVVPYIFTAHAHRARRLFSGASVRSRSMKARYLLNVSVLNHAACAQKQYVVSHRVHHHCFAPRSERACGYHRPCARIKYVGQSQSCMVYNY